MGYFRQRQYLGSRYIWSADPDSGEQTAVVQEEAGAKGARRNNNQKGERQNEVRFESRHIVHDFCTNDRVVDHSFGSFVLALAQKTERITS